MGTGIEWDDRSNVGADGLNAGTWLRVFTKEGVHPFDEIEWRVVDAEIRNADGTVKFSQPRVEVPSWWSQNTVNIVADKYLRMVNGVKETSVKQTFSRVAATIRSWGESQGFFNTKEDASVFEEELLHSLVHQYGAFNSPVWFNLGIPDRKQAASACFISEVDDSLESINNFAASEKTIFAGGSGSGANLSKIRSSYERLSSGAYVCGPLGWMEEHDKGAKAMKSGGSTRNAAKMVVLDVDHPDIIETKDGRPGFITCKAVEERRAQDLIRAGYSSTFDDPNCAYKWVSFQNANHSVSLPDAFMKAVIEDGEWCTVARTSGEIVHKYKAREVWKHVSEAAWTCGCPGVQFTDTINKWHTTPLAGRIRASNPCSEFLHVDNTACNLCAINLTRFFESRAFIYEKFAHAVRVFSVSQMILVNMADYPTEAIRQNSLKLKPIGTNYGNLGALLMRLGLPYDSDKGRAVAARLASLMTALVYKNAAMVAARLGPFPAFHENRSDMLRVIGMHREADSDILSRWNVESDPLARPANGHAGVDPVALSKAAWDEAAALGETHGYYVSQATLQAPLGTISFLMGMDTTGIEPSYSLVSYKTMVGGGDMRLANGSISEALTSLNYSIPQADAIRSFLDAHDTIEGAPGLKESDLPVFDCAMPSGDSKRYLSPMAHLKMMAAIQPLITCAQSKTVNLSNDVTAEEVADVYMESWKLGLKCVALYRDGCKKVQVLSSKKDEAPSAKPDAHRPSIRRRMPEDVDGHRHQFELGGFKGYINMNEYPDGSLGEVFLKVGKSGSTVAGLIDGFTQLLSIALQYGVPLDKIIRSFTYTRFEPAGWTSNPKVRSATSIFDYLFKVLDVRYYGGAVSGIGQQQPQVMAALEPPSVRTVSTSDAPPCNSCGSVTRRNGSCYLCDHCGQSLGCS